MKNNLPRVGDLVRRTQVSAVAGMHVGLVYRVVGIGFDGLISVEPVMGDAEWLTGHYFSSSSFQVVDPATEVLPHEIVPRFTMGDLVRATAKVGEDIATFRVASVSPNGQTLYSRAHVFRGSRWDFELVSRPAPRVPTIQDTWRSMPVGSVFTITGLPSVDPKHKHLKVSATRFHTLGKSEPTTFYPLAPWSATAAGNPTITVLLNPKNTP